MLLIPTLAGLELINEPFAGDLYRDPLLMVPFPNPASADRVNLQPAYDRVSAAVRAADADALVFFAGVTWGDLGAGFSAAPGGSAHANKSVLAYHYYPPPQDSAQLQFEAYSAAARRLGTAAFLTETSAPGSPWPASLPPKHRFETPGGVGDGADAALQSWAGFEWKSFCREAAGPETNVSQLGVWGACKTGYSHDWPGTAPTAASQAAYGRTWAPAVAGTTLSMFFNVTSAAFSLEYDAADPMTAAGAAPTEIFIWPQRYPHGASVTAKAAEGTVRVEYTRGGSTVQIHADDGLQPGARVSVSILPTGMAAELAVAS